MELKGISIEKRNEIKLILAVKKIIIKDFKCRKKFRMIVFVRTGNDGKERQGKW